MPKKIVTSRQLQVTRLYMWELDKREKRSLIIIDSSFFLLSKKRLRKDFRTCFLVDVL
jgi:hypothetical protein